MKKYLFLFALCLVLFGSCSDAEEIIPDDDKTEQKPDEEEPQPPQVEFDENTDLAPVIEAEGGSSEVTFTATADWQADVRFDDDSEATRATVWCTISPVSGSAGTATITITVEPNEATEGRTAVIVVDCGGVTITLTITQEGAEEPDLIEDMESAFPDPVFRAYILENFDSDGSGTLSEEEVLAVTELNLSLSFDDKYDESKQIKTFAGIEYFTNLTYLACQYHKITDLDLSNNPKLRELVCRYCGTITNLNVSKCEELRMLLCNYNKITNLDLSNNTKLIQLGCCDNFITTLDISKQTELLLFECWNNQLTELDISNNQELISVYCSSNQIVNLDLNNNAKLEYLDCSGNQLKELDVSKTNLGNSSKNYPLVCSMMGTLKKIYIKTGWEIDGITFNRSGFYIPYHTEIVYVD